MPLSQKASSLEHWESDPARKRPGLILRSDAYIASPSLSKGTATVLLNQSLASQAIATAGISRRALYLRDLRLPSKLIKTF